VADDRPPTTPEDRRLAELGAASADDTPDPSRLDELALERLRRGKLDAAAREELLASLADDPAARAAWAERASDQLPLDDAQVDRIAAAVTEQRRAEGLPLGRPRRLRVARVAPWIALVAAGIAVVLVLPRIQVKPGPLPPPYELELSGQLAEFRGDEVPLGVPAYSADSILQIALRPPAGAPALANLQVIPIAVGPDGHPLVIEDAEAFTLQEREGVIVIRGPARSVAGDQAGSWRLFFVLSSRERAPALGPLERKAAQLAAAGVEDGAHEWPGGLRVVVGTFQYLP